MSYICEYLQFASNTKRVPGYGTDLIASNQPYALIPKKLVDPTLNDLWDLVFSYESGGFYPASFNVPGNNGATIESWYQKEGNGNGDHYLSFIPFVIDETGGGNTGFAQATHFVDFSQPTPLDSAIDTDTIAGASVMATVHQDLPEYAKLTIASHATSYSIIITSTTTRADFDKIFVYGGNQVPSGNALTVQKNQSCNALAVYKLTSSSSSQEVSTIKYPKIPKSEWPQYVSEIVNEIVQNQRGQIYEHLGARAIATLDKESLQSAVAAVTQHIEELTKIKTVISGLGGKAVK